MIRVCLRAHGSVRTYGAPAASEGSNLTDRLQSENPCTVSTLFLMFRPRFVKVPLLALSRKPATLSHAEAASMTLPWLCAWITVDTLANVKEGDNVIIIGP